MKDPQIRGRKVFFLHPPSVIQDELIYTLIVHEYEAYVLNDHRIVRRLLRKYPHSILFVNLDEGRREEEWEELIRALKADNALDDVRIGIVSYNEDEEVKRKYLIDIGAECGYIRLKLGLEESTRIILKTLEVNEAKGRRRYLRVTCSGIGQTGFNLKYRGELHHGTIADISTVGMAVYFNSPIDLVPNTRLRDIQLNLRGVITAASGVYHGVNREQSNVYVILFDANIHATNRNKIRTFIHNVLKSKLEQEIDRIT